VWILVYKLGRKADARFVNDLTWRNNKPQVYRLLLLEVWYFSDEISDAETNLGWTIPCGWSTVLRQGITAAPASTLQQLRSIHTYQWRVSAVSVPSAQCPAQKHRQMYFKWNSSRMSVAVNGRYWYGTDTSLISVNWPLSSTNISYVMEEIPQLNSARVSHDVVRQSLDLERRKFCDLIPEDGGGGVAFNSCIYWVSEHR
jgi:hypothetical protein